MKRILSLSLTALFLIFTACQNDGPVTGPEAPSQKIVKKSEPKWIGLPQNADNLLQKTHETQSHVTKANGGHLGISDSYTSVDGRAISCSSTIDFAPNTVRLDCDITMSIDDATGTSTFLPHQMFDQCAILNQTFSGLDLSNVNPNNVKLYYMATDGTFEEMANDGLVVDVPTGTITVINGKIPHFSVYGFGE